ncbi:unnamed protein product, partial [Mesorhabditis spiculigera]
MTRILVFLMVLVGLAVAQGEPALNDLKIGSPASAPTIEPGQPENGLPSSSPGQPVELPDVSVGEEEGADGEKVKVFSIHSKDMGDQKITLGKNSVKVQSKTVF